MQNKKLKKIFSLIIIVCGMYSLSKIRVNENANSFEINDKSYLHNGTLAAHLLMPPRIKGKKLPFHQVYESRQIGFPTDIKKMKGSSNATKIILLWTLWNGVQNTINYYWLQSGNRSFVTYNCPNQNCVTTHKRKYLQKADAVLFHLLDTKSDDLPQNRTAKQLWIMYNMEAPWQIKKNVHSEFKYLKHIFNWTMTYREDSHIIARYGYIQKTGMKSTFESFQNKTRNIVWFVSDCKTDSKREDYVNELKKYIDIDVYGKCGDHTCYPSQSAICYKDVLNKYKFYLSFENAICKDYVTEKFFNIFNYDIIPIVFGRANYSAIAPKDSFIDAIKYSEPKLLAHFLLNISNNKNIYNKILENKRSFHAYLDPWMCRLCNALHMNVESSVLQDVEEWWYKEDHCRSWSKTKLTFVDTE